MPFSRGVFILGDPIWVPEDSDDNLIEKKRLELEEQLNILTERADRYWDPPEAGKYGDPDL